MVGNRYNFALLLRESTREIYLNSIDNEILRSMMEKGWIQRFGIG